MNGIVEGELAAGPHDVLAGDNIPDSNQSYTCFSCDEPLTQLYCAKCGQKNDDYRRSLWKLGAEAIASLTAVENRIWRTWAALLFKPGKVARQFADGARTKWSSPVRVYIFTSILLFGFMELSGTYFFALQAKLTPAEGVTKPVSEWTKDDVIGWDADAHFFPTRKQIDAWNDEVNFEVFADVMNDIDLNVKSYAFDWGDEDSSVDTIIDAINAAREAGERLTPEDLKTLQADIESMLEDLPESGREQARNAVANVVGELQTSPPLEDAPSPRSEGSADEQPDSSEALESGDPNNFDLALDSGSRYFSDYLQHPEIGNNILNKWLPRIMFLMMPLTMFIGVIFIRGRGNALMYDHLVHATYVHAVAFFTLFVGIFIGRWLPTSEAGGTLALILLLYLLIYLPISLKAMFSRGWIKTIWTAYSVAFIYLLIVSIFTVFAIVMGLTDHYGKLAP